MVTPALTTVYRNGKFQFTCQDHVYPDGPTWTAEAMVFCHSVTNGLKVLVVLRNNAKFGIEGAAELAAYMNDARSIAGLYATVSFGDITGETFTQAYPLYITRASHYQDAVRVYCHGREETMTPYIYVGEHKGYQFSGWEDYFEFVADAADIPKRNYTPMTEYDDGLAHWLGSEDQPGTMGSSFDAVSYIGSFNYITECEGSSGSKRFGFYGYTDYIDGQYQMNVRVPDVDEDAKLAYTYTGVPDQLVRHFWAIPRQGEVGLQQWAWWWYGYVGEYKIDRTKFWVHNIVQDMPDTYTKSDIREINRRALQILSSRTGFLRLAGGEMNRRLLDIINVSYIGRSENVMSPTSNYWVSGVNHRIMNGQWETEYELARPGT